MQKLYTFETKRVTSSFIKRVKINHTTFFNMLWLTKCWIITEKFLIIVRLLTNGR